MFTKIYKKIYNQKISGILLSSAILVALSLGLGVLQPAEAWASKAEPSVSAVALSVSLNLSSATANPGESVTVSGTAKANTWVSIKIMDSAQNIIFYDAIKSGADGSYSDIFKVPSLPGSTLTVVAGYGSSVATKTLVVTNATTLLTPPTLTADSSGNIAGSAVDLTFTDDAAWRAAITGMTVSGTALTTKQYTVRAGSINIAAGVLNTAGNHTIVVQATGYTDASVIQVTQAAANLVTGIVLKPISSSEIDLSWNKFDGAKSYTIYRAASENGTYAKIGSVKTPSYKDKKLQASTSYWYKVTATTAEGESDFSEVKTAATKAVVPRALKAKATSTSITLTWQEAAGSTFNVYRSTARKGTYTKIKEALSTATYTDLDISAGTVYWYKVTAANPAGEESAASSVVSAALKLVGPSNLKANAVSKKEIDLSWDKLTGAQSYIIYRAVSADGVYKKAGTSKTADFKDKSGLKAETAYWYKVTAVAATGEGEYSEAVTATTLSAAK